MTTSTSSYVVSARKYRPQTFDAIVGQAHVTNTLKNAILNNKIAQAYLFFGPRGVGKTTCARVFAKTINCLNIQKNGEACHTCDSCTAFNSNTSFNIYELDAASNNSVEDIRQLIDQVRYPPQIGKYKVYIIDEIHMLSTAAFNAFLKTLEEPPAYAKFILATTEKNKVPPTILSRCQVFNFHRIKTEDIARYLEKIAVKENHRFEPEALRIIAQKADGGLRDACSLYDQMVAFTQGHITTQAVIENLHILDYDYYFQLTEAFLNQEYHKVLLLIDDILNKGFDPHHVLVGLMDHIRYLLLAKDPQTLAVLDVSDAAKSSILEQSKKCSEKFLLNALSKLNKADVNFRVSRHPRLHLEIHFLQLASLNQMLADTEKKNLNDIPSAPSSSAHSDASSHSYAKFIKVSDKPLLSHVIVQTTASLKEIKSALNHTITDTSASIHEESTSTSKVPPSSFSDDDLQDRAPAHTSSAYSVQEKSSAYSPSLSGLPNTPALAHSTSSVQTTPLDTSNKETELSASEKSIEEKPLSTKNFSNDNVVQSITEKKYQMLLLQNPLLEELKIKLNLTFS